MKRSFADILQGLDSDRAAKLARKLPEWAAVGAEIPTALSFEQCSSSATASYKASVAGQAAAAANLRFAHPSHAWRRGPLPLTKPRVATGLPAALPAPVIGTVLDLTGGLGVDSWALSRVAERVVYFERDAELAAAAERNFARLGAANIEVRCETVTPESELPEADLIYADPARRNAAGRKVFLLEDCTPDILTLLPMLLRKAPTVLLKLSPMADLAMLAERLGPALREIHVVELDGEMKELLCLLVRDATPAEPDIVVVSLSGQAAGFAARSGQLPPETSFGPHRCASLAVPPLTMPRVARSPEAVAADVPQLCLRFRMSEERAAEVQYATELRPGDVLLEPCPALLKAGAFRLPCARWGLLKLAASTHLYLLPTVPGAKEAVSAPGDPIFPSPGANTGVSAPGSQFFKAWRVRETLPFGAAAFRELRKRYPRADVTSRNMPLGSAELQKKLGIAPGGDTHIFACRLADGSPVLITAIAG